MGEMQGRWEPVENTYCNKLWSFASGMPLGAAAKQRGLMRLHNKRSHSAPFIVEMGGV